VVVASRCGESNEPSNDAVPSARGQRNDVPIGVHPYRKNWSYLVAFSKAKKPSPPLPLFVKRALLVLVRHVKAFASALKYWAPEGDEIDPPVGFPPVPPGGLEDPILTFKSWSEVSQMCGDSRVWAGLHFEVSNSVYAILKWPESLLLPMRSGCF